MPDTCYEYPKPDWGRIAQIKKIEKLWVRYLSSDVGRRPASPRLENIAHSKAVRGLLPPGARG